MCGIAGVIELKAGAGRPDIGAMTSCMAHRGPDAQGVYVDDLVSLGHRRLSIIDLTDAANQPFFDNASRYVLVFNGEIYNFQEVRKELAEHPFRTNSDTEVVLAAYLKWGVDCVHKLAGMFAFALWDKEKKEMFLVRDRFGVKPLYYIHTDCFFAFASELRPLLTSGLCDRSFDSNAIGEYFAFQSFGTPHTPLQQIKQMQPGSYILVDKAGCRSGIYWTPVRLDRDVMGMGEVQVHQRIRELFFRSVERRLVSDVPVGAFLSGGIDSSAVVAVMASVAPRKPVTFNVAFNEADYNEEAYAELVARKFGTDHRTVRMTSDDFLNEVGTALDAMDIPSADGVNTYVVSKAVKNAGITVALSGLGGDELFAGYPFFQTISRLHDNEQLLKVLKPLAGPVSGLGKWLGSQKFERISGILGQGDFSVSSLYPHFRRVLGERRLNELLRIMPLHSASGETPAHPVTGADLLPVLSQVSICEYSGYTLNTLLKDTDQMSMAVALEVREPFFDHELVEYVLNVPDKFKYPRYPKSLLVESLKPLIPDEVVHRRKQGFLFPWSIWMKNQLQGFCDLRLKRMAGRAFVNGPALLDLWRRFQAGDKEVRWTELWMFVVLEHWLDRNGL